MSVTEELPDPEWLDLGQRFYCTIPLVERAALPVKQLPESVSNAHGGQEESYGSTVPSLLEDGKKQTLSGLLYPQKAEERRGWGIKHARRGLGVEVGVGWGKECPGPSSGVLCAYDYTGMGSAG